MPTKNARKRGRAAKKPVSMTPAAIASRRYRAGMAESRARARRGRRVRRVLKLVPKTLNNINAEAMAAALDHAVGGGGHTPWNDHHRASDDGMPEPTETRTVLHGLQHGFDQNGVWGDGPFPTVEDSIANACDPTPPRSRGDVVREMFRQRNLPRGITQADLDEATPLRDLGDSRRHGPYSAATQDAAKFRECLTDCTKLLAEAMVRSARIIAGDPEIEDLIDKDFAEVEENPWTWRVVGPGTPLHSWLETRRVGIDAQGRYEGGTNETMCLMRAIGDEAEWVDRDGRTTVTHSTFLAPTHWRWPTSRKGCPR